MTDNLTFVFKLIAAIVENREYPETPDNLDWEWIYVLCNKHNIANIIAYAVMMNKYCIPQEIKQKFNKKMYERLSVCENQNAEVNKVFNFLEDNNLKYMPLKGINLQKLYPQKDMRFMADVDILIKPEDITIINSFLLREGYTFKVESNHEYVYEKKPYTTIEFHKYLIPSYNEDMYAYYGDGWKLAKKEWGSKYILNDEDEFIYIFTHFAKHYRDTGAGLKMLIDIWLYLNKKQNLDLIYIKEQLNKLKLLNFFDNVMELINCWFGDGEYNEITKNMTVFILDSGTFGNQKNQMAVKTIRDYVDMDYSNAQKFRYIKMVFPGLKDMKKIFPVLKKVSFLLPFCWLIRIFKLIAFKRKNILKHIQAVQCINTESMDEIKNHMDMVGLDIYNGRKNK